LKKASSTDEYDGMFYPSHPTLVPCDYCRRLSLGGSVTDEFNSTGRTQSPEIK
jgi:hypothetical protein